MKDIAKVKLNSKEFTIILLIEYSYCLAVYFCFTIIPFQKSLDIGRAIKFVLIYYAISLIPPTVFNILQIIKAMRKKDYGKLSNHLIIQILVIFLVFWIAY
jgi:hypothetical protein